MLWRRRRGQTELEWIDEERFRVAGVGVRVPAGAAALSLHRERLCLVKPGWSARLLAELLRAEAPRRIFELGIYDGGSTALLRHWPAPRSWSRSTSRSSAAPGSTRSWPRTGSARRSRPTTASTRPTRRSSTGSSTRSSATLTSTWCSTTPRTRRAHPPLVRPALPPPAPRGLLPDRGLELGAHARTTCGREGPRSPPSSSSWCSPPPATRSHPGDLDQPGLDAAAPRRGRARPRRLRGRGPARG